MSRYWSNILNNIEPYIPGEQPQDRKYIKLNTNENPYPPSPKVIEAIKSSANEDLRLYPDPDCSLLRITIADYCNLGKDNIFVGNGSDEILALAFYSFFKQDKPITSKAHHTGFSPEKPDPTSDLIDARNFSIIPCSV